MSQMILPLTTVEDKKNLQIRLKAYGWYSGTIDGVIGPMSLAAFKLALDRLDDLHATPVASRPTTVPIEWMPDVAMDRIIVHWTAGGYQANAVDRRHYHILIEGDGDLVRGIPSIALNPPSGIITGYAAHTRNCNSGSIGVSMCCMLNAHQEPFDAGAYPMTAEQWNMMIRVVADLSKKYSIPVSKKTILTHAEVQGTLGITQAGKWDIARLAFDPSVVGATEVGDKLRAAVVSMRGTNV